MRNRHKPRLQNSNDNGRTPRREGSRRRWDRPADENPLAGLSRYLFATDLRDAPRPMDAEPSEPVAFGI